MRAKELVITATVAAATFLLVSCSWFPSAIEPGYRSLLTWGTLGEGPGELKEPIGIAIKDNEVFVSEGGNNRIQVFDLNGNYLRSFGRKGNGSGELDRPMLMDIKNGKLYVAEYNNDRIQIFDLKGNPLGTIGSSGSGQGQFDSPGGVVVDKQGNPHGV